MREHAQVREANRHECERREVEKTVASGRRGHRGGARESVEAANPPQSQPMPTTAPQVHSDATTMEAATPPTHNSNRHTHHR